MIYKTPMPPPDKPLPGGTQALTPEQRAAQATPSEQAPEGVLARLVDFVRVVIESIDPALSPRFLLGSIGGGLLGIVALIIVSRSGHALQPVTVRLLGPVATAATPAATRVRIAVAPVWSPKASFSHYDTLAAYLGTRLDQPVVVMQRKTYGEINELLAKGSIQGAIVCTGAYLHALRHGIAIQAIAVPVIHAEPYYYSLIIVAAASPAQTFTDLAGHSFAFTDPDSLAGYFDPTMLILHAHRSPASFFSRTFFTYGHEESMRAVRDGRVEAAAVDSLVYEYELAHNPPWQDSLRVLQRSPAYGAGPVVVPASLEPALREALRTAYLGMHETPAGKEVLQALRIDRFISPPAGLYDNAAKVVREVEDHGESQQ